jgi:lipopolysaccharide assembly outer membrane protein LptD (OstA)
MSLRCKFISKFSSLYWFTCVAFIFIFFITNKAHAQVDEKSRDATAHAVDSIQQKRIALSDTLAVRSDSLKADTSKTDSVRSQTLEERLGIKISKDALPSVVKAKSRDSAVMNVNDKLFYLYGKAQVNYEDMQLNAGQVAFNQSSNVVTAAPYIIEKDTGTAKNTFSQGSEKFTYDSMQYNFRSKRAIVRNVRTQYDQGFIHSEQIKRNPDQSIYGARSIYTTCALDTPHFGIMASRIKAIPGKVVVSGPANLCIEGIPTPLFLPFGLFPSTQKQKSGFIIPTYAVAQDRGLGLVNGGYYFYVNDYVDLNMRADMYAKGSYMVSAGSTYRYLYHYGGLFRLAYSNLKTGEDFEPGGGETKDFMVNWSHQSDAKSKPGQNFNASVTAGTSSFYAKNSYDLNKILNNQYQSNITYSKNWQGKPFGLTISALHNQNTQTKQVNVTLPDINFYVSQINPFQNKRAIGEHWYDKITASYTLAALNRISFYDTAINLAKLGLQDFQSGVRQNIPIGASYNVLRYVNMSFSVNYTEYWVNDATYTRFDTVKGLIEDKRYGFFATREFNTGVNFTTRIYGMLMFKHSWVRGIRHVLTPGIGVSYHPDFALKPFNYYYLTTVDTTQTLYYRSPYSRSVYTGPPEGRAALINYTLNNNLQIKIRSLKDTVSGFKNIVLIDGFSIGGNYNAAADSFRWSPVAVSFRTNVANVINITSSATYDPYLFDYQLGRRTQTTMLENGTGIAKFVRANLSMGSNFHSKSRGGVKNATNSDEYARIRRIAGYADYVDFNIPWSFNVSYSLDAVNNISSFSKRDTVVVTHSATFDFEVLVTERWKLRVNSGYNFNEGRLQPTQLDLYRDLHCWAMNLSSIPFGPRKNFTFTLNVKAAVLQDLKLVRRRDFLDAR